MRSTRHRLVQKFGGTSVGSADAIRRVVDIVTAHAEHNPIVVVSAVGGVTNQLFKLRDVALSGGDFEIAHAALAAQHATILGELGIARDLLDPFLRDLDDMVRGIALLGECTPRTMDTLASFGERMSARIVAAHLEAIGIPARAIDAWDAGLVTDGRFGGARPLPDTAQRIRAALENVDVVPVITGYVAHDERGHVTTLGRGGSDYSAAIFGAALGVEEIQIWTDVDGVMTADPRKVKSARHVQRLSFAEAAELAFFGAKVLHPSTMVPAVEKGIPIRVVNTWRPTFEGTLVVRKLERGERAVKSIATKEHIVAVNVVASAMMFQYGFLERIADAFARHEIVVDVIATSEVSVALTTDASADLRAVVAELESFAEVTVVRELALVSIVGEELRDGLGIPALVFATLAELGVRAEMSSFGATRNNWSLVIAGADLSRAVAALHERLFERT